MQKNYQNLFEEKQPKSFGEIDHAKFLISVVVLTGAPGKVDLFTMTTEVRLIGVGKSTEGMRLKNVIKRSDSSLKDERVEYINLNYYITVPPTKFDVTLDNASVSLGLRVIYVVEFANQAAKYGIFLMLTLKLIYLDKILCWKTFLERVNQLDLNLEKFDLAFVLRHYIKKSAFNVCFLLQITINLNDRFVYFI